MGLKKTRNEQSSFRCKQMKGEKQWLLMGCRRENLRPDLEFQSYDISIGKKAYLSPKLIRRQFKSPQGSDDRRVC